MHYEHAVVWRRWSQERRAGYWFVALPGGSKEHVDEGVTLMDVLNGLGSEGWALVAVEPVAETTSEPKYWLRREAD